VTEAPVPRSHHRTVTITLVLLNLAAVAFALYQGGPGNRDWHFRAGDDSFINWIYSAQMLGAALLFFACHFAARMIRTERSRKGDATTWLIFAVGFLILALDQEFRIRDQIAVLLEGDIASPDEVSTAATVLKFLAAGAALALVVALRESVLANFRMVVSFMAGFWVLLAMLLLDWLLEGITGPGPLPNIVTGTAKLLAMALFLSASYAALLDRLLAAQEAMVLSWQTGGRTPTPERKGSVTGPAEAVSEQTESTVESRKSTDDGSDPDPAPDKEPPEEEKPKDA